MVFCVLCVWRLGVLVWTLAGFVCRFGGLVMAKSGLFLFVWLGWWVLFGVACCFSCCVWFVILVWVCF